MLDRIMACISSSRFGSCRFRDQSCDVQVHFYFYFFFYFVLFCSKSRIWSFFIAFVQSIVRLLLVHSTKADPSQAHFLNILSAIAWGLCRYKTVLKCLRESWSFQMESVQKCFLRNSALTDSRVNPTFTSFYFLQHINVISWKEIICFQLFSGRK
jgi:hypothetical protein